MRGTGGPKHEPPSLAVPWLFNPRPVTFLSERPMPHLSRRACDACLGRDVLGSPLWTLERDAAGLRVSL